MDSATQWLEDGQIAHCICYLGLTYVIDSYEPVYVGEWLTLTQKVDERG